MDISINISVHPTMAILKKMQKNNNLFLLRATPKHYAHSMLQHKYIKNKKLNHVHKNS